MLSSLVPVFKGFIIQIVSNRTCSWPTSINFSYWGSHWRLLCLSLLSRGLRQTLLHLIWFLLSRGLRKHCIYHLGSVRSWLCHQSRACWLQLSSGFCQTPLCWFLLSSRRLRLNCLYQIIFLSSKGFQRTFSSCLCPRVALKDPVLFTLFLQSGWSSHHPSDTCPCLILLEMFQSFFDILKTVSIC